MSDSKTHEFAEDENVARYELDGAVVVIARDEADPMALTIHCHGPVEHFRADGTCEHTDEFLSVQKPDSAPMRVLLWCGWGSRDAMTAGQEQA